MSQPRNGQFLVRSPRCKRHYPPTGCRLAVLSLTVSPYNDCGSLVVPRAQRTLQGRTRPGILPRFGWLPGHVCAAQNGNEQAMWGPPLPPKLRLAVEASILLQVGTKLPGTAHQATRVDRPGNALIINQAKDGQSIPPLVLPNKKTPT